MSRLSIGLDERLNDYLVSCGQAEHPVAAKLRALTAAMPNARMQIAPEQGQFLAFLVRLIGARATLEVGTFCGYSALWVALALPADGRLVACGALEQKFWDVFCGAIGLAAPLRNDLADVAATRAGIAAIIAGRTADDWRPVLAAADCCVTVVASLEESLRDAHFAARGLFDHRVAGSSGQTIPALPLPLAPEFRAPAGAKPAPPRISAKPPRA